MINLGILLYWIIDLVFACDWVCWVHTSAVEISKESFDEINYTMMGYYKIAVILLSMTPYLVLRFVKFTQPTSQRAF